IKEAQRAFKCPEGFKLSAVPPPSASRSVIYMYGVRASHARKVQKPSGRYYCLASQSCREAQTFLKLPKGGTSSATDHLGNLHG
ncbi:unnamed protein product, partial [Laminaria digitata]